MKAGLHVWVRFAVGCLLSDIRALRSIIGTAFTAGGGVLILLIVLEIGTSDQTVRYQLPDWVYLATFYYLLLSGFLVVGTPWIYHLPRRIAAHGIRGVVGLLPCPFDLKEVAEIVLDRSAPSRQRRLMKKGLHTVMRVEGIVEMSRDMYVVLRVPDVEGVVVKTIFRRSFDDELYAGFKEGVHVGVLGQFTKYEWDLSKGSVIVLDDCVLCPVGV